MSELTVGILAPADLATLATQINAAHEEAQSYVGKAVERALVAGDLLNSVKAQLRHGEFIPWCKAHCPAISQRTINNYMRVARELPAEMRSAAHLSVREALRLVSGEPSDLNTIEGKSERDEPSDEPTTIDRHYSIFLNKKIELLDEQMDGRLLCCDKPTSKEQWLEVFDGVTDDKQGLRNYATDVIRHPATNKRDVLSKFMTLTIMLDGSELPVCSAMSALFGHGDYKRSIESLDSCIDLKPDGVNTFMEVRSEVIRHFDHSFQVPF
jgi:hypothetical protein